MINEEYKVLFASMKLICTDLLLLLEEPEVHASFAVEMISPKIEKLFSLLELVDMNELFEERKGTWVFSKN